MPRNKTFTTLKFNSEGSNHLGFSSGAKGVMEDLINLAIIVRNKNYCPLL